MVSQFDFDSELCLYITKKFTKTTEMTLALCARSACVCVAYFFDTRRVLYLQRYAVKLTSGLFDAQLSAELRVI